MCYTGYDFMVDVAQEKYWEYKEEFRRSYTHVWSFHKLNNELLKIKEWFDRNEFNETKFHYSKEHSHIMIGTDDPSDAFKVKMSWGGVCE